MKGIGMYKILKSKNGKGYFINDSEGIPMEWDTLEEVQLVVDLYEKSQKVTDQFQSSPLHGYSYIIVYPPKKI
jgi:hypothetical protein